MQTGTASWIPPFTDDQLAAWTAKALANSAYRDSKLDDPNPLPRIDHVIYIVKGTDIRHTDPAKILP